MVDDSVDMKEQLAQIPDNKNVEVFPLTKTMLAMTSSRREQVQAHHRPQTLVERNQ